MASSEGNALSLIKAVLELVADRRTGVLDVRRSDGGRPDADLLRRRQAAVRGRRGAGRDVRPPADAARRDHQRSVRPRDRRDDAGGDGEQPAALRRGRRRAGRPDAEQVERGLAEQVCGHRQPGACSGGIAVGRSRRLPRPPKPPRSFSLAINPAVLDGAATVIRPRAAVADVVAARPEELVVVARVQLAPAADVRDDRRRRRGGARDADGRRAGIPEGHGAASRREDGVGGDRAAPRLRAAAGVAGVPAVRDVGQGEELSRGADESDQQALLEIAQRAKKRDPMFAFGSYVIGQLAMWAGDEATAKKFFYEALRLDPTSEAGQQVRILARRGTAGPAQPGVEGPPRPEPPAEPAPVAAPVPAVASVPPAQTVPASPPSKAPSSGGSRWLVPGLALLATAAIGIFAVARRSPPAAELAPSVSPQPALSVDALSGRRARTRGTTAAPPPLKETKAMTDKDPEEAGADADMGTVLLPPRAAGHRIFVDGRRGKTDGSEPLRLRCGRHAVQIGSSGTPETIDLPCGGEVQLQ